LLLLRTAGIVKLEENCALNSLWLIIGSLAAFAVAYRFYGAFLATRVAMLDDRASRERGAMPADADERLRETGLRLFGKIGDLRDVRQIIAGERNDVRPPAFEHPEIGAAVLDLQIDQLDRMSRLPCRLGDEFKADRLKAQKEL